MWLKCLFVHIFVQLLQVSPEEHHLTNKSEFTFREHDDKVVLVPKCNTNETLCEEVEVYPKNTFYRFLQDSTYEEYFETQEEPLSNRFDPDTDHHLCKSIVTTKFPQAAVNTRNEWKFVYNFDKYKQRLVTEECMEQGHCSPLPDAPRDVGTKCVQKYTDRLLLVADEDGRPVWDFFLIPSACVCSYVPKINFNKV